MTGKGSFSAFATNTYAGSFCQSVFVTVFSCCLHRVKRVCFPVKMHLTGTSTKTAAQLLNATRAPPSRLRRAVVTGSDGEDLAAQILCHA